MRYFSLAIVLFWIATVAWLGAVIWAPPESRMAQVDPREVYQAFFDWNDSVNLTLLEHGVRRGRLTLSGGSGPDEETKDLVRDLNFVLSLESYDESSASYLGDQVWKGVLIFSESMDLHEGELSVRVPARDISIHLSFGGKGMEGGSEPYRGMRIRVAMAGQEIFVFDPTSLGDTDAAGALIRQSLGSLPQLDSLDPARWEIETDARKGSFTLGGRDLQAYLLHLRFVDQDQSLRLYLSEAGEPLRLESDLGFEAVSELLVPLDAFKRQPSP